MNKLNLDIIKYLSMDTIVSQTKLEQQLYLVDWFNCLGYSKQLSNFEWKSDNGPKAKGLNKLIHDYEEFFKIMKKNDIKYLHFEKNNYEFLELTEDNKKIIDFVLEKTKDKNITEIKDYVFASYPFQAPYREFDLNLEKLAFDYLEQKIEFEEENIREM